MLLILSTKLVCTRYIFYYRCLVYVVYTLSFTDNVCILADQFIHRFYCTVFYFRLMFCQQTAAATAEKSKIKRSSLTVGRYPAYII